MRNCSQKVSQILCALAILTGVASAQAKIVTQVESRAKTIQPTVKYEFSRTVGRGRLMKVQDGQPGSVKQTYRITYKNGKPVAKTLIKEERTEATNTVYAMGYGGYTQSRGAFSRTKVITMSATAYDPSPATIGRGATGRTALGMIATFGHVAVDPRVIPLGSLVFVEGYGFAIASDKGSAIKGNKIDLCYDSRSKALSFGRKKVKVHVFSKR